MAPSKRINKETVCMLAPQILDWCMMTYSGYTTDISIEIDYCKKPKTKDYALYDFTDRNITVMYNVSNTPKKLITAIIHEYTHSLQNHGWYYRYHNLVGYWNNPYELAARKKESEWIECYNDIFKSNIK